jgi:NAD(P)-dependent dehydrogenase (short-subunit alcohol dehydrogenase family)
MTNAMQASQLFDLTGKIALITGASRGIGASIAKILAANGAHVIISSRKLEGCQQVVDDIIASGGSAEAMPCHIGDNQQIAALFTQIKSQYPQLDILINNAATNPYFGHILDTDLTAFEKTVDVNIRGYFFMSVNGAKLMPKSGGAIVNVASVNGVIPGDFQGIYSITKAAVISMTKAFAKECAPLNIRVNAILPGATDTKFAATLVKNPAILKQALTHIPMNKVAKPDEMAGAVLYLVSNAASYTTGTCINVDGGYLLA